MGLEEEEEEARDSASDSESDPGPEAKKDIFLRNYSGGVERTWLRKELAFFLQETKKISTLS